MNQSQRRGKGPKLAQAIGALLAMLSPVLWVLGSDPETRDGVGLMKLIALALFVTGLALYLGGRAVKWWRED